MRRPAFYLCHILLLCISGCGGGGGGGDSASTPTKAVTSFSTSLASGQTGTFGSVEFTADLPTGVTVPADSNGVINSSALVLVDKALAVSTKFVLGTYTLPSNGLPAKVHIGVITLNAAGNGTGMLPGKFATLTCGITQGASVSAAILGQPDNVVVTDPEGTIISVSTAQVSSVTILE